MAGFYLHRKESLSPSDDQVDFMTDMIIPNNIPEETLARHCSER